MVRVSSFALILVVYFLHHNEPVGAEREVLVRDRLLFLLCDQMKEYMDSGNFPEAIKVMPEKYKQIHPGKSQAGRSFGMPGGRQDKSNKGRGMQHRLRRESPVTVLDLSDDLF